MRFRDRRAAGRVLAEHLAGLGLVDAVVLALPRGGVPVAYEVAAGLDGVLDVFVACKVGAPGEPEYGIGAVAEGDAGDLLVTDAVAALGITDDQLRKLVAGARAELERRVRRYRGSRPLPDLGGRDVVLVDDGLATGVTAEAALRALRARRPRRLVLAAPVCPPDTARRLEAAGLADGVACVLAPHDFRAVGQAYADFTQTQDVEVLDLLLRAAAEGRGPYVRARRPAEGP